MQPHCCVTVIVDSDTICTYFRNVNNRCQIISGLIRRKKCEINSGTSNVGGYKSEWSPWPPLCCDWLGIYPFKVDAKVRTFSQLSTLAILISGTSTGNVRGCQGIIAKCVLTATKGTFFRAPACSIYPSRKWQRTVARGRRKTRRYIQKITFGVKSSGTRTVTNPSS